jgi:hypothetical protein
LTIVAALHDGKFEREPEMFVILAANKPFGEGFLKSALPGATDRGVDRWKLERMSGD